MVSLIINEPDVRECPPATMSWPEYASRAVGVHPVLAGLSPAERVVAACLCQGLTNKEIALRLGKSVATVKNQVAACLAKLQVPTRGRLMALCR